MKVIYLLNYKYYINVMWQEQEEKKFTDLRGFNKVFMQAIIILKHRTKENTNLNLILKLCQEKSDYHQI